MLNFPKKQVNKAWEGDFYLQKKINYGIRNFFLNTLPPFLTLNVVSSQKKLIPGLWNNPFVFKVAQILHFYG
jgi:hypothetical protein